MDRGPDPFAILAGARAPAELPREDRVRLLGEAAQALLEGRMPSDKARLFLGGALVAWLARGGDLERDYLRVRQRGSHRTPSKLWAALIADEDSDEPEALGSASRQPAKD